MWEISLSWGIAAVCLIGAVFVFPNMAGGRFAVTLCYAAAAGFFLYGVIGVLSRFWEPFRRIRYGIWIAAAVWLVSFIVVQGLIWHGAQSDARPGASYIVILGAGLWGETPSPTLAKRLLAAADYLEANPEAIAIPTGGQGPDEAITEAEAGYRFLVNKGVDPARIWKEDASRNTDENIRFAARLIRERGSIDAPVVICSSEFHLFRARFLAGRNKLNASALAAPTPYWHLKALYAVREYFSVLFAFLPSKPVL